MDGRRIDGVGGVSSPSSMAGDEVELGQIGEIVKRNGKTLMPYYPYTKKQKKPNTFIPRIRIFLQNRMIWFRIRSSRSRYFKKLDGFLIGSDIFIIRFNRN